MSYFGSKRKWGQILESKPVLAFLFLLLLVFGWSVLGFWGKMNETAKNKEMVENRVSELRVEKERLTGSIAKLETQSGVEEGIREKFGLIKEGEGLIVILDEKDFSNPEAQGEEEGGFWNFFKNLFK